MFKNTEHDAEQFLLQRTNFLNVFFIIGLMLTTDFLLNSVQDSDFYGGGKLKEVSCIF